LRRADAVVRKYDTSFNFGANVKRKGGKGGGRKRRARGSVSPKARQRAKEMFGGGS
jgi:hypothetical protein